MGCSVLLLLRNDMKMKSIKLCIVLAFVSIAIFFAGCKTEQMKSTPFYEGDDIKYAGAIENRLNLWPTVYWREPVGSVMWPILSFADDHFAFRPIYSRYKDEHCFLWPFGRYDSATGDARFFPVFEYHGKNGDFSTVFIGRKTLQSGTEWWWLTPLVGHESGDAYGFHFDPVVKLCRSVNLEKMDRLMNAERLDGSIAGKTRPEFDRKNLVTNDVFRTESIPVAYKVRRFFSFGLLNLFADSRYVYSHGGDNGKIHGQSFRDGVKKAAGDDWREGDARTVAFTEESKFGDELLFGLKTTRVVNFDYDLKAKVFDGEVFDARSVFGMLWSCRNERVAGARDYSKHTFLWYLWRREELNGDVAVDVFPGFTYDSKKSGCKNVSFLWRLFRYRSDSGGGTAVDVFFLPVWR